MSKEIYFDDKARGILQEGMNIAANAVVSTLGPRGKTGVINPGFGHPPIMSKDGVTLSRAISLNDQLKNTGAMLVRYASEATVKEAGDGTTTSAALVQSMVNNGLKAVKMGKNAQEVKSGMEKAVDCIVSSLKGISIPLDNNELIRNIATVSANNDPEIGNKLAEAYSKIGHEGLLTIEQSKTSETYVDIVGGAEMENGYANTKFITDKERKEVVYENPLILVLNYQVKTVKEITPFMMEASKTHNFNEQPLVIVALGFDGEPHNFFVVNCEKGAKVCLVEAPNRYQRQSLSDIATITGATMISDDSGKKVAHARLSDCGSCKRMIITRASTMVVEGAGKDEDLDELKRTIQFDIDEETDEGMIEVHTARLARVSGSVGVIYVGGATSIESSERKDRVDDANRAIKSAVDEGVVPGGGLALIRASSVFDSATFVGDETVGRDIIRKACQEPLKRMLLNAGVDTGNAFTRLFRKLLFNRNVMVSSVFSKVSKGEGNYGYNLKSGEFVDMVEDKIIDPTKVVRSALQNSSSVAAQLINSSVLLIEVQPK